MQKSIDISRIANNSAHPDYSNKRSSSLQNDIQLRSPIQTQPRRNFDPNYLSIANGDPNYFLGDSEDNGGGSRYSPNHMADSLRSKSGSITTEQSQFFSESSQGQ